ncbi:putative Lipoprotein [Candidatus Accumulibacter aalborgensis]|uniref:Putative Lipoprotein n=1 Tax=Candidatus Accumulibacter aalborgensis TaxID=1860102 RepID=A0A1A8XL46_9PROT|nr:DUF3313 domain-containing protein [Candidatus Accumulibacter aalborgensis]SBT05870.1 putative Lipoprotein [Candidatus Accumulibacter aalborgensis]
MKTPRIADRAGAARAIGTVALAGLTLLTGCATDSTLLGSGTTTLASDKARLTHSGFLSDYARLQPTPWGHGIECWRDPSLDARNYDKILVARILVSLKVKNAEQTFDPKDIKTLTDYFHQDLVKALKPQMPVVEQAGPGVVVLRVALTDLVPTTVTDSLAGTLIPYAFIAEAGSGAATGRPAGSTPYMGETGMEMQFRDGASGKVIAECRDTEIGRKYAVDVNESAAGAAQTWANGYLSSFQAWSYAKDAFDKWSMLVAQRIAQLRGVQP